MNLDAAVRHLHRTLCRVDGVNIQYRRADQTVNIRCIRDDVNILGDETQKLRVKRSTMIFAVLRPEFRWQDGTAIVPEVGDCIVMDGTRSDVVNGPNNRPWDTEDAGEQIMTIYTQKGGTDA